MDDLFNDGSREVLKLAKDEAIRLKHGYIGTEHILIGLIREGSGIVATVLGEFNIELEKTRAETAIIVQTGFDDLWGGWLPQTPRAKKIIEFAIDESRKLGCNYVGTEHLLLGLIRDHESLATQILMNLGVDIAALRKKTLALFGSRLQP